MAEIRRARAEWTGDLMTGRGQVSGVTTGAFQALPVSWKARAEQTVQGTTSPEELLGAAHASCFSMALAGELARAGARTERLEVSCAVTFDKTDQGYRVTQSVLEVRGQVSGLEEGRFQELARAAGQSCPVSKALGGVKIEVRAELLSAEAAPAVH